MFDIHCHILPDIDDGAKNISVTFSMLKAALHQGVKGIVATPHLDVENDFCSFLAKRKLKMDEIAKIIEVNNIDIKIFSGAEIYLSPALPSYVKSYGIDDFKKATGIAETKYLLVEMPFYSTPIHMQNTLFDLVLLGFAPIIAHVERYSWLAQDTSMLKSLSDIGCYFQVNASNIGKSNGKQMKRIIDNLFYNGFVHFIASDAHSDNVRCINLEKYVLEAGIRFGVRIISDIIDNSARMVNNEKVRSELLSVKKHSIIRFLTGRRE